jgi:LPXTG-motif cell wall-anchored protein
MAAATVAGDPPAGPRGWKEGLPMKGETMMEPLAWLGLLAVVIGLIGVIVLVKGRKNKTR